MNCREAGVLGAVVGIVGVTQALQAIQLIVGDAGFEPLNGKLWLRIVIKLANADANPSPSCTVAHARDAVVLPRMLRVV